MSLKEIAISFDIKKKGLIPQIRDLESSQVFIYNSLLRDNVLQIIEANIFILW